MAEIELLRRAQAGGWHASGEEPTEKPEFAGHEEELLRAVSQERPAVLLSVGHGAGPRLPPGLAAAQRAVQGDIVLGNGRTLGASLENRPFLPLGVWFSVACFSAGTPARSVYEGWLRSLPAAVRPDGLDAMLDGLSLDHKAFVAALPQRLLAQEDGPLAVIGHVDLAWTYGFWDPDNPSLKRSHHYLEVIRHLLRGKRVGVAAAALARAYHQANDWLLSDYQEEQDMKVPMPHFQVNLARRGHLWMLHHDLRGYVTLGDPAVRLGSEMPSQRALRVAVQAAAKNWGSSPSRLACAARRRRAKWHRL